MNFHPESDLKNITYAFLSTFWKRLFQTSSERPQFGEPDIDGSDEGPVADCCTAGNGIAKRGREVAGQTILWKYKTLRNHRIVKFVQNTDRQCYLK